MVKRLLARGKSILTSPQSNILSAAGVIMAMMFLSAALGLIRRRVILHFFVPDDYALLEASFRIPDFFTAVFTLATLSSAFIPVFTKIYKRDRKDAWDVSARIMNTGILIFIPLLLVFLVSAERLFSLIAPGFSVTEIEKIAAYGRVIFLAQGIFVVSYVITGVLESLRRFLVPALAPLFYNLGIIFSTIAFSSIFGQMAPVYGVFLGALLHLLIQLPLALRLGFRFKLKFKPSGGVRKIGQLAAPRIFEISFLQTSKMFELFLASLISTASYGYYNLAVSIQTLPVSMFGTAIAKAALPTLTRLEGSSKAFSKVLVSTIYQVIFLVLPFSVMLIIFRVPIVRLLFGTDLFDWPATIQTGLVLSAFAFSIPFQSVIALLNRAFYALHDTKTPVAISIGGTVITIIVSFVLVFTLHLLTWGLAASYTTGIIFQAVFLFYLLSRKINGGKIFDLTPVFKCLSASLVAGGTMFFILKFFDRSVWVKRLSFLGSIEGLSSLNFEKFVLDTRYTVNLFILTLVTATIGLGVYIFVSFILRSRELAAILSLVRTRRFTPPPKKEPEPITSGLGDKIGGF